MKLSKYILSVIFINYFLCVAYISSAQNATVYKEFQLINNQAVVITSAGNIEIFNLGRNNLKNTITVNKNKAASFYIDTIENKLFVSFEDKTFKTFDFNIFSSSNKLKEIASVELQEHISGFLKNSGNVIWGICPGGMFDVSNNKYIKADTNSNTYQGINFFRGHHPEPYCWEMDSNDNIWLGYGFGEWGGGLKIFDTKKEEFKILDTCLRKASYMPIKSFFNYKDDVVTTNSLQHIMAPNSYIYLIKNNCAINILNTSSVDWIGNCDTCYYDNSGLYLGPAAYNSTLEKIYFYCEKGIFKVNNLKEIKDSTKWQLVFKPKLLWNYGQPDAVGYSMNVKKMIAFEKNKILFLAPSNGIGYYDGKRYYLLK